MLRGSSSSLSPSHCKSFRWVIPRQPHELGLEKLTQGPLVIRQVGDAHGFSRPTSTLHILRCTVIINCFVVCSCCEPFQFFGGVRFGSLYIIRQCWSNLHGCTSSVWSNILIKALRITLVASVAMTRTWLSKWSAISILDVRASENKHLIHRESLLMSLVSICQVASMICCSHVNHQKNRKYPCQ